MFICNRNRLCVLYNQNLYIDITEKHHLICVSISHMFSFFLSLSLVSLILLIFSRIQAAHAVEYGTRSSFCNSKMAKPEDISITVNGEKEKTDEEAEKNEEEKEEDSKLLKPKVRIKFDICYDSRIH